MISRGCHARYLPIRGSSAGTSARVLSHFLRSGCDHALNYGEPTVTKSAVARSNGISRFGCANTVDNPFFHGSTCCEISLVLDQPAGLSRLHEPQCWEHRTGESRRNRRTVVCRMLASRDSEVPETTAKGEDGSFIVPLPRRLSVYLSVVEAPAVDQSPWCIRRLHVGSPSRRWHVELGSNTFNHLPGIP